jgi:hypothetical protein
MSNLYLCTFLLKGPFYKKFCLIRKFLLTLEKLNFFSCTAKMVGAAAEAGAGVGARAEIIDKPEPERHKNGPAPQH